MSKKSLIGYAAAGAVGVIIGVLVAPEKGSKNLTRIKGFINDWATRMLDEIEAGKQVAAEYADDAVDAAYEFKGKAESKIEDLSDRAYELKDEAEAKADDFADDVRKTYNDAQSTIKKDLS